MRDVCFRVEVAIHCTAEEEGGKVTRSPSVMSSAAPALLGKLGKLAPAAHALKQKVSDKLAPSTDAFKQTLRIGDSSRSPRPQLVQADMVVHMWKEFGQEEVEVYVRR